MKMRIGMMDASINTGCAGFRGALIIIALSLILGACAAGSPAPGGGQTTRAERRSVAGFYFDTVVTIVAYDAEQSVLEDALKRCEAYEALLSKTIEGSDVSRINRAGGAPIEADAHTLAILETAARISRRSGGAFDVTIAPVMALWDFTGGESRAIPDEAALKAALALVDYEKVTITHNRVSLPDGMMIDLGGIAKGYIADKVAQYLEERGVKSCMLNFGGNVVFIGGKPDGTPWNVGIQDPDEMTGASIGVVRTDMRSAVTSGIYERGFDLDGVRYHHILDPKTGKPVQNSLASITVFSQSSALGDALSTACFVLGYEGALALLEGFADVQAVFVFRDRSVKTTQGIAESFELLVK